MTERMDIIPLVRAWWRGDLTVLSLPSLPLVSDEILMVPTFIREIEESLIVGGRADSQDVGYQKVSDSFFTPEYLNQYYNWLEANLKRSVKYDARFFDCDNYAIGYWTWCNLCYSKMYKDTKAQSPLIGYAKSQDLKHTFNFAITETGLRFYDPQVGPISQPDGIYWMQF